MAVKIRLRRMGTTKKPFYRLVAADGRYATNGRFLEALGWYDPKMEGANFKVNLERIAYWMDKGALPSETAQSLIKKAQAGISAEMPGTKAVAPALEAEHVVEAAAAPEAESAAEALVEAAPVTEEKDNA